VALSVATTVVSSSPDRFVVDAGSKVLAGDRPAWLEGFAAVPALGDAPVTRLSEHHGVVDRTDGSWSSPRVGEVVLLTPNHACTVANLAAEYLVVREGEVVDRWPVDARGRNA
jgi:D-serine deaminase-like pyridoxal phosphate-dependent protein